MDHFQGLEGASFLKIWPLMLLAVFPLFEKNPYARDAQRSEGTPNPMVFKNSCRDINLAIFNLFVLVWISIHLPELKF
jgi:hypothetical protein